MSDGAFAGRRVALLEVRRSSEAAELVRRLGGEPVLAPALHEQAVAAGPAVGALLDEMASDTVRTAVFLTGVAVGCLLDEARALGRERECLNSLSRTRLAVRGPKPAAALAAIGLRALIQAASPFTTERLLHALGPPPIAGEGVAILHHGERNRVLSDALAARGAVVRDLVLYEWRLPDDTGPLDELVDAIVDGQIDVIAFTSQIQARHLFEVAGRHRANALRAALNERTLVGAIGPVCAEVLTELGIPSPVVPAQHKLRPFLTALAAALP